MTKKLILLSLVALALMVGGCSKESPVAPALMETGAGNGLAKQPVTTALSQSRPASRCENVSIQGMAYLNVHTIDFGGLDDVLWSALSDAGAFDAHRPFAPASYVDEGAKTVTGFGAVPGDDFVIAGVSGTLSSIVTHDQKPGGGQQGQMRARLIHLFQGEGGSSFVTMDQAVLAPTGTNPAIFRVNDDLDIIAGTGVFANASGKLKNRGIIDYGTYTLTINLTGRVCGDGI